MSHHCDFYLKNYGRRCNKPFTEENFLNYCDFHYQGYYRLLDKVCMSYGTRFDGSLYFFCNNPSIYSSRFCSQHTKYREPPGIKNYNQCVDDLKNSRKKRGYKEEKKETQFEKKDSQEKKKPKVQQEEKALEIRKEKPVQEKEKEKEPEIPIKKKEETEKIKGDGEEFNSLKEAVELLRETQNHILLKLYDNNKQDVVNIQAAIGAKILLNKMNGQILSMNSE